MPKDRGVAAVISGAWVTIGLLYGDGDIQKTIEYACRCGDDSDCNPSNAGAIVGVLLGYNAQPGAWRTSIEAAATGKYSATQWTWNNLIASSFNRAQKAILAGNGTVTADSVSIEIQTPTAPPYWENYGAEPVLLDSSFAEARLYAKTYCAGRYFTYDATASIGAGLTYSWDFGDGNTSALAQPFHAYAATDTYTVTLRTQGNRGADTAQARIYFNPPAGTSPACLKCKGTPITSVPVPTGAGDKDINVIRDYIYPSSGGFAVAYDTYTGSPHAEEWFGYTYTTPYSFTKVYYLYGSRETNRGVFVLPRVQVQQNTTWNDVTGAVLAPASYNPSALASFDTFSITFPPVPGTGIRVIGAPQGGWVGCAELDVFDTTVYTGIVNGKPVANGTDVIRVSPHPMQAAVTFSFRAGTLVRALRIYNTDGMLVHEAAGPMFAPCLQWNGKDRSGQTVPPGLYFYSLSTGQKEFSGKIIKAD
jgi:hypothetical protein